MWGTGGHIIVLALLLGTSSGCGTIFNITGHEPWLLGKAPMRPIGPFGGVDNDLRCMKRGAIVAPAIDMPLSLVGDVITLPWTAYQSLRPPRIAMKRYFDNQAMREEILKYLALGMPIENAKQIMEASGFQCEDGFLWNPACLCCVAVYRTHHLFISDEIHVHLRHDAGKLSGIEVDCHSISP